MVFCSNEVIFGLEAMDGADIFDLSTVDLLQELSSIDHHPESER
jgi:hypothetical protein